MSTDRRGIIRESRNAARTKIMSFCIGNSRVFVATHHFSYRGTPRAFFHRIVHAPGHGHTHAKKGDANNEKDKDRSDDGKFNGRRAALISANAGSEPPHE